MCLGGRDSCPRDDKRNTRKPEAPSEVVSTLSVRFAFQFVDLKIESDVEAPAMQADGWLGSQQDKRRETGDFLPGLWSASAQG